MRNIKVSVDEETYRRVRLKAAEMDMSVSALVRSYLTDLAAGKSEFEQLAAEERDLRARIGAFRGGDRLERDELHELHGRGSGLVQ